MRSTQSSFVGVLVLLLVVVLSTSTSCDAFTVVVVVPAKTTITRRGLLTTRTTTKQQKQQQSSVIHHYRPSTSLLLMSADEADGNTSAAEQQQSESAVAAAAAAAADPTAGSSSKSSGGSDEDNSSSSSKNAVALEAGSHDELLYALGVNLARQLGDVRPLVETGDELAQVAKGLLDTVIGRLDDDGQRDLLKRRGGELNNLITDRANKIKERLREAGATMLQEMAKTENAVTLESGVVLDVLEGAAEGTRPTKSSTVKIHYHGTLADGTVFDSTLGGEPVSLPLAGVIPGWREAVLKLHQGQTAMVGIPPDQAYGENGMPDGSIPGGSTLFFKIQLLEVLSAGIEDGPTLLGADGQTLKKGGGGSGLLGVDGKPLEK